MMNTTMDIMMMDYNHKDFNKQQITKIRESIKQAKLEGRKVIGYLAGGDEYYFKSLRTIRRVSLFLSIIWGTLATLNILDIIISMSYPFFKASMLFAPLVLGSVSIIVFILLIRIFRFETSPSGVKKNLIGSIIISIIFTPTWFSTMYINIGLSLVYGIAFIIAAIVSGVALIDIPNYRDWFVGYGKKKRKTRNKKSKENQSNMPKKEGSMRLISDAVDLASDVYDVDPKVFAGVYPYSKNMRIFKQMENKVNSFDLKSYQDDADEQLYKMAKDFIKYLLGEIRTYIQQEELANNIHGISSYQYTRETERLIRQMRKYEADYKETLRRMVDYGKRHYS